MKYILSFYILFSSNCGFCQLDVSVNLTPRIERYISKIHPPIQQYGSSGLPLAETKYKITPQLRFFGNYQFKKLYASIGVSGIYSRSNEIAYSDETYSGGGSSMLYYEETYYNASFDYFYLGLKLTGGIIINKKWLTIQFGPYILSDFLIHNKEYDFKVFKKSNVWPNQMMMENVDKMPYPYLANNRYAIGLDISPRYTFKKIPLYIQLRPSFGVYLSSAKKTLGYANYIPIEDNTFFELGLGVGYILN